MDFELSEDQEALAEGVAALCAGRFDIETIRSMATEGLDRGRWAELAETGVFSLTRPEADGGLGMGWAEAVVVFEQLGRALVPGPLVATTLTAAFVGLADAEGAELAESAVRGADGAEAAEGAELAEGVVRGADGAEAAEGAELAEGVVRGADGAEAAEGAELAEGVVRGADGAEAAEGAELAEGVVRGADGAEAAEGAELAEGVVRGADGAEAAEGAELAEGVVRDSEGAEAAEGAELAEGVVRDSEGAELADGAAQGTMVVGSQERGEGRCYVEFLEWIDALVISDDDGLWWVDAAALRSTATPAAHPLDPLTPVSAVSELPRGRRIAHAETANVWRQCGALLTSALQLGIAGGATDLAVEYAKQREQFGKPIGAFQAVKHRCADMITRVEVLRAAVYAAGATSDGKGVDDPARSIAVAKVLASSAAAACGKDAVQVHGGMGYTWEVDAHLFLKRAWVHDLAFGDGDHYAEQLARGLLSDVAT